MCFWCQGVVTDPSPQTAAPSSQDTSGQQPLSVENTGDHATAYSYQQSKWVFWRDVVLYIANSLGSCFSAVNAVLLPSFSQVVFLCFKLTQIVVAVLLKVGAKWKEDGSCCGIDYAMLISHTLHDRETFSDIIFRTNRKQRFHSIHFHYFIVEISLYRFIHKRVSFSAVHDNLHAFQRD